MHQMKRIVDFLKRHIVRHKLINFDFFIQVILNKTRDTIAGLPPLKFKYFKKINFMRKHHLLFDFTSKSCSSFILKFY